MGVLPDVVVRHLLVRRVGGGRRRQNRQPAAVFLEVSTAAIPLSREAGAMLWDAIRLQEAALADDRIATQRMIWV